MNHRILSAFLFVLVAATSISLRAQQITPPAGTANTAAKADEAARQQILQSERWKNAVHGLQQWLSIQQLYTPEEVAVLRAQFKSRIDRMSPAQLEAQLAQLEEKLAVLSSPDAEDARRWLAQFLAVQRKYSDAQLRQMRPDIANMTAAQIRQELQKFQARRGQSQMFQSAAQQGRALQVQSAHNVQDARRQAQQAARKQAAQGASTAATFAPPSQPPRQQVVPVPTYTVGPWGNPVIWDPMIGFW